MRDRLTVGSFGNQNRHGRSTSFDRPMRGPARKACSSPISRFVACASRAGLWPNLFGYRFPAPLSHNANARMSTMESGRTSARSLSAVSTDGWIVSQPVSPREIVSRTNTNSRTFSDRRRLDGLGRRIELHGSKSVDHGRVVGSPVHAEGTHKACRPPRQLATSPSAEAPLPRQLKSFHNFASTKQDGRGLPHLTADHVQAVVSPVNEVDVRDTRWPEHH